MVLFDIFMTNLILDNMYMGSHFRFFEIVYVKNTGAAFSSFQHLTVGLIIIAILAVIWILYELFRDLKKYTLPLYFVSAMLISGIVCNTYERITLGYVRDFINLKHIDFPIFNISDVLINVAVLAIIILVITKKYKRS